MTFVALLLATSNVSADGMSFKLIGAQAEIRATEQRAILYKPGVQADWQLHIQPVFDRDAGQAAWVVPLPVRPTVSEGSADFFDQLELLTSPVFLKVCSKSHGGGCFGCGDDAKGLGEGDLLGGDALVTVWERDSVGGLDYVLLSAADGDSLVLWLEAEGYAVGQEAQTLLADFESEGVVWFAARLALSADPTKPLPPVRFDLPGVDEPTYPLRLTSLGVPAGQTLGLTLWVIHPDNTPGWAPEARGTLASWPSNRQAFDDAVETFFEGNPDQLLTLYSHIPGYWGGAEMQVCSDMLPCIPYEEVGLEAPETWCPEIQSVLDHNQWVSRYEGRLGPGALASDLVMELHADGLEWVRNIYEEYTCDKEARVDWILLLGVGLGFLIHRRRRLA